MAITNRVHKKSNYKYVRGWTCSGKIHWCVSIRGVAQSGFDTERLAALAADKYLIKMGKEPVNILVKKYLI